MFFPFFTQKIKVPFFFHPFFLFSPLIIFFICSFVDDSKGTVFFLSFFSNGRGSFYSTFPPLSPNPLNMSSSNAFPPLGINGALVAIFIFFFPPFSYGISFIQFIQGHLILFPSVFPPIMAFSHFLFPPPFPLKIL